MKTNIEGQFELNQKDTYLDDTCILWTGNTVQLFGRPAFNEVGKHLATFTAGTGVVVKIQRWCVKNSYRCSAIVAGKIML